MKIDIKYDKKADTLYLCFSHERIAYSKQLDAGRSVDYSNEGEIIGFRFVSASSGVNTDGLPHRSAIEHALSNNGFVQRTQVQAVKPAHVRQNSPIKVRILSFLWTSLAILIFAGSLAASIWLARTLFVLESLPGLMAALFGLMITLFPTVIGGVILWLIVGCALQKRPLESSESVPAKRDRVVLD